jgi:hypothetical protein
MDFLQFQDRQKQANQVRFRHDFNTLAFDVVKAPLVLPEDFDNPGGMLFQVFLLLIWNLQSRRPRKSSPCPVLIPHCVSQFRRDASALSASHVELKFKG